MFYEVRAISSQLVRETVIFFIRCNVLLIKLSAAQNFILRSSFIMINKEYWLANPETKTICILSLTPTTVVYIYNDHYVRYLY